jgi:hypothetical protein
MPVVALGAFGPIAYTPPVDTKNTRPREIAAPPNTGSGIPTDCPALSSRLFGSSTSLSTSALSASGRTMKNLPLSVPTKSLPSPITIGAF